MSSPNRPTRSCLSTWLLVWLAAAASMPAGEGARAADSVGLRLFYEDGSKINLCTVRGAKTSASSNCITPADLVCQPVHTQEMRFHSNYGAAWWMIELPAVFRISHHRVGYRDPMTSLGYRIKVSATALDDAGWARQAPVFEYCGPVRQLGHDGLSRCWTAGEFAPVEARFVRIEWFGHNGSERGESGRDHPDLIVAKIQLYGPNRLEINPSISVAQSAWAGGSVSLDDAAGGSSSVGAVIDDSDPQARGFGYLNQGYQTNPGDADLAKLPAKPTAFVVTLKHTGMVEAVGYSAVAPPRDERPRDMKVYTSPHAIGEHWTLQEELHDIAGGAYEEMAFPAPVKAKRVKFVVERVWNTRADPQRRTAGGYLAELYVYATALPGNVPVALDNDAVTSASIFDTRGGLVRTLWQLRPLKAGKHLEEWDGLTDTLQEALAGRYELRLLSNAGCYENVAALGNTGHPPDADGHVPVSLSAVAVDDEGAVYSANGWDEAGHDWKKWDRDGLSLMHSNYQVRNGDPNGLPYRIAVDQRFLYVVYISHGGGKRFFYFANGDGIQAYRLLGDELRFVMALGGHDPDVHGKFQTREPLGQWTWTDADGDAAVEQQEVNWHKQPGEGRYAVFGMNVDSRGNVIYCDHHTRSIWLIPLAGLNPAGNPLYDWSRAHVLIPPDEGPVQFFPLMAVRNERDEVYAFGRSELFPQHAGSGPAWMGGWALAKFDAAAQRLWATRLVQHCTGMDYVPGDGGVVVGYFAKAVVYHYNRDGILVGSSGPGAPAAGVSGWLDNTASIACNRDPRDGRIDVFAEEDYAHRILWYRFDDSQIRVTRQTIEKE